MLWMRRTVVTIATTLAALLTLPGIALGTLTEVGLTHAQSQQVPPVQSTPSCPGNPCLAVSRTTGYQVKVGPERGLFIAPRDGVIVAWSITQAKPTKKQIAYFDANEGGPASAGIAILRSGPSLTYRLIAQSPIIPLEPYFGETAQFPLATQIPIKKGYVVALTVPTWAPALALGFGNDTSWRPSRPKTKCNDTTTQTAQTTLQVVATYSCLYRKARLTYTATLISTP